MFTIRYISKNVTPFVKKFRSNALGLTHIANSQGCVELIRLGVRGL